MIMYLNLNLNLNLNLETVMEHGKWWNLTGPANHQLSANNKIGKTKPSLIPALPMQGSEPSAFNRIGSSKPPQTSATSTQVEDGSIKETLQNLPKPIPENQIQELNTLAANAHNPKTPAKP